jgi:hypothetical protein
MHSAAMAAELSTLEARREALLAEREQPSPPEPIALHPALAAVFANEVERLQEALQAPALRVEASGLCAAS